MGILEPLDGVDFTDYCERLNSYFVTNNIGQVADDATEETKRVADWEKVATTISLISKKTYSTLQDLSLPNLLADKTYDQLVEILKGYNKPKVIEEGETYRFHHTVESENESVTEHASKLKRLVVHCNFGPYLTRALRGQFIGGVRSQTTKKKLLSEDRTFEQALGVARADVLEKKESKLLQTNTDKSNSKLQTVNTVNKKHNPIRDNRSQSTPKTQAEGKNCF